MSYPFDDHDDDLSEKLILSVSKYLAFLFIVDTLYSVSNITSLHYLLYFFAGNYMYDREFLEVFLIRKSLFNSEKPK